MTVFLIIAVLMAVAALLWVLLPLMKRRAGTGVAGASINLAIYRDQLADLDVDLSNGTLSAEKYQQAKLDIERRALDESADEDAPAIVEPRRGRWTAAVLAVAIPVSAALLYGVLGNFEALSPQPGGTPGLAAHEVEAMVAKLAARLEQKPDDVKGWTILARSYSAMQRLPEAVAAYAKAAALAPDDADLLADYADALALSSGRTIEGKPLEIVKQALKIDPDQWKALALAGTAAFDRKDYKAALVYWERLLQRLPPESQFRPTLTASIDEARQLGGIKTSASPVPSPAARDGSVRGTVSLSPALAGKVQPTDTVFIFARAAEGPRQPLAAVRHQVKDLPVSFALDDSQAMSPEMKLSRFGEVVVGARISKSGGAMPLSGDLFGSSRKIKVGATAVAVVIDQVTP